MKKGNKFGARKVTFRGIEFASKKECERYIELLDMQKKGKIENLKLQEEFILIPENKFFKAVIYIADFVYEDGDGLIVEDVKGLKKGAAYSLFKIKQKLFYQKYHVVIREI